MKDLEPDPVISEIRETRHRISERFGHDPRRLVAHYIQKQQLQRSQSACDQLAGEVANGPTGGCSGPAPRSAEPCF
jgi:hypothetical protein